MIGGGGGTRKLTPKPTRGKIYGTTPPMKKPTTSPPHHHKEKSESESHDFPFEKCLDKSGILPDVNWPESLKKEGVKCERTGQGTGWGVPGPVGYYQCKCSNRGSGPDCNEPERKIGDSDCYNKDSEPPSAGAKPKYDPDNCQPGDQLDGLFKDEKRVTDIGKCENCGGYYTIWNGDCYPVYNRDGVYCDVDPFAKPVDPKYCGLLEPDKKKSDKKKSDKKDSGEDYSLGDDVEEYIPTTQPPGPEYIPTTQPPGPEYIPTRPPSSGQYLSSSQRQPGLRSDSITKKLGKPTPPNNSSSFIYTLLFIGSGVAVILFLLYFLKKNKVF
jgi:hypothetical protein